MAERDPSDFPGNPNPPAKAPQQAKAPAAPAAPASSAGTGALPPSSESPAGANPLAKAGDSSSYSVNDDGIYSFTDTEARQVAAVTLAPADAKKVLEASGAHFDAARGTYDNVPEETVKVLASGKPSFGQELKARFAAGEAELHRASLYDAALLGKMSFADARDRANPDLVQVQLAQHPGAAWHGLGDAVARLLEHPVEEGGAILRQSVMKTAEALPSILSVAKGAAGGAAAGALVGLPAGAAGKGAEWGARAGTFASLLHMEVGGVAADMHERGFDEATIKKLAPAAGAVKAGLWMYGAEAMAAPFKSAFFKGLAENEVAKKAIASWAAAYLGNVGKMGAMGEVQANVADLTNNFAAMVDKRPDLMRTAKDFLKNGTNAAIDMMQVTAVGGLPGAGVEALGEARLAAKTDARLEGVERREPLAPTAQGASPSGASTPSPAAQTASGEPLSGKPPSPLESPAPATADLKSPLPNSVKEHPAFVKAVEDAKEFLPEGVDPHNRKAVVEEYRKAAQDAHDFNNTAMVQLGKDEVGQAALTPDEKNQISAQMHENVMRMAALRQLALFARDPEAKVAYEDWKAGGAQGEQPALPVDPFDESKTASPAEAKLEETLADKSAEPRAVLDAVKAATPADRLAEKTQEATVKARGAQVKSDLEALQQRIGEVAATRDRMKKNGLSTKAIDRQVNTLLDQAVSTQKELETIQNRPSEDLEVSARAKLQMKPATLEDVMQAGFKEGGKQSQARARELLSIAQENGLTAADVKKLVGNRAPGAMGDAAYRNFLEGFEREGERTPGFKEEVASLVERKQARAEVAQVLKDKELEREQYIRQLHGLPAFSKMTTEQLKGYADILRQYDKGDEALSPKRIAALKGIVLENGAGGKDVSLEDVQTMGGVRKKAAEFTGRPLEDFQNVRVPLKARAIPDPHLRAWFPALRPFVDLAGTISEKGDRLAEVVNTRLDELAAAAIKERHAKMGAGARFADWFAPQQREVMAYAEAKEPAEVAAAADKLTPAELKWATTRKMLFSTFENYLIKKEGMESRFSGAYAAHVNRGWPEILRDLKEQGVFKSLAEFLPKDSGTRDDFVDAQGNVLGFNKFFRQSKYRTGALEPSRNLAVADRRYVNDFYRKAALDQIAPVLDTLARSMKADEDLGQHPKESEAQTSSLQDFVKAYVNNKKGINNSAGAVGELVAPALRMTQTLVAIHYIAGNYALQAIKGAVAIPASEYMALGSGLFKARALKWLPGETGGQARAILDRYESFTGKSPWQEVSKPGADVSDFSSALLFGGFAMAHKAAMEDILLASMTKEEFAAGKISDARLNQMRQEAGRWLDLHGSDSIMGSHTVGKTFTQYKGWAIPPVLSIAEDARALARQVTGKGKMSEVQARETMRLVVLAAVATTSGAYLSKDMEDDTYRGQAIHYLRRALGSVWRGLDPAFFFSAAGPGYVAKLANDLSLLVRLEEDKSGDLKGAKGLKKDLTPRVVKDVSRAVEGE